MASEANVPARTMDSPKPLSEDRIVEAVQECVSLFQRERIVPTSQQSSSQQKLARDTLLGLLPLDTHDVCYAIAVMSHILTKYHRDFQLLVPQEIERISKERLRRQKGLHEHSLCCNLPNKRLDMEYQVPGDRPSPFAPSTPSFKPDKSATAIVRTTQAASSEFSCTECPFVGSSQRSLASHSIVHKRHRHALAKSAVASDVAAVPPIADNRSASVLSAPPPPVARLPADGRLFPKMVGGHFSASAYPTVPRYIPFQLTAMPTSNMPSAALPDTAQSQKAGTVKATFSTEPSVNATPSTAAAAEVVSFSTAEFIAGRATSLLSPAVATNLPKSAAVPDRVCQLTAPNSAALPCSVVLHAVVPLHMPPGKLCSAAADLAAEVGITQASAVELKDRGYSTPEDLLLLAQVRKFPDNLDFLTNGRDRDCLEVYLTKTCKAELTLPHTDTLQEFDWNTVMPSTIGRSVEISGVSDAGTSDVEKSILKRPYPDDFRVSDTTHGVSAHRFKDARHPSQSGDECGSDGYERPRPLSGSDWEAPYPLSRWPSYEPYPVPGHPAYRPSPVTENPSYRPHSCSTVPRHQPYPVPGNPSYQPFPVFALRSFRPAYPR